MEWLTIVLTSSVAGILASTLIGFLKEKYFDSDARARRTKTLAINLVYILDKFALKCATDFADVCLFVQSGGLYEGNNGNHMGCEHSKLPKLYLELEKMNWEGLETSYISAINNLSIKTIIAQSNIDDTGEILENKLAIDEYIKAICSIGFTTISIANQLREKYHLYNPNIEKSDHMEELLFEYNKFKVQGAYKD